MQEDEKESDCRKQTCNTFDIFTIAVAIPGVPDLPLGPGFPRSPEIDVGCQPTYWGKFESYVTKGASGLFPARE